MEKIILPESFGTLSETVNGLNQLGYTHDFNIQDECLICRQTNTILQPSEFHIDKVYRFEGASNPDDESIVYAISSSKFNMMGTLVNGYGVSADENTSALVGKLQTNQPSEYPVYRANEATPQRPEGDRILNAPLVEMDLNKFIDQLKNESTWAESDRNSLTIFKSDSLRIVLLGLHEKAEMPTHTANGMISVQVLSGKLQFTTEDRQTSIEQGQMIALQANIPHSVTALEASFFLLTLAMNER